MLQHFDGARRGGADAFVDRLRKLASGRAERPTITDGQRRNVPENDAVGFVTSYLSVTAQLIWTHREIRQ
ncbi:MAG: hypothetical protein K2X57_23670 [Xanthobacteraceae bacterium]|nr:hypothetical protein [Xanthobacteraceae bacterium]